MRQLIIVLFITVALPVSAEVQLANDTGFIIENSIDVSADAQTVWRALVNDVDQWWPKDHSWWGTNGRFNIDAAAGGCFCEVAGERSVEHMHIVFVDPGQLLRMTGGLGPLQSMGISGVLDWRLESADQGTRITLTYRVSGINPGGFAELAPVVDSVQALQLGGLGNYLQKPVD